MVAHIIRTVMKGVILNIIICKPCVCSVRPSTMTEDYAVPDAMVGLSEYMSIYLLNHTNIPCVWYVLSLKFTYFFNVVAEVIGRGGEQINKIQHDSGCKVQIAHGEPKFSYFLYSK